MYQSKLRVVVRASDDFFDTRTFAGSLIERNNENNASVIRMKVVPDDGSNLTLARWSEATRVEMRARFSRASRRIDRLDDPSNCNRVSAISRRPIVSANAPLMHAHAGAPDAGETRPEILAKLQARVRDCSRSPIEISS